MPPPKREDPSRLPMGAPPGFKGSLILMALLGLSVLVLWLLGRSVEGGAIRYDEFKRYLGEGRIESVQLGRDEIRGTYKEGRAPEAEAGGKGDPATPPKVFLTYRVDDEDLVKELETQGVHYSGEKPSTGAPMFSLVMYLGLALLLLMLLGGGLGRAARGPASVLSFGKSKGKVFQEDEVDVTFADVAGIDEAKVELREIIDFLQQPERYTGLGAKIPKGVLLVGPPGTGKTLLARAVAGEAGVPFISINGSEFVEMFVGVGASRVRDLFEQASRAAPCIVFIDELDAIGRTRTGVGVGSGSNEEREQTLNQLLVELDGFQPHKAVIIMSATNRPEILDPALLRPGRFDRQVLVDRPDRGGRREILKVHVRKVPLEDAVDLDAIAAQTPGFAGADLQNLVNEAALRAARRGAQRVSPEDFSQAIDRVVAGLERRSRLIGSEEKARIAVHEIGHAITARCAGSHDVQKISIIPHGLSALGYTRKSPSEERQLMTESMLRGELVSLLGGRAAELLVYGEASTGAANDLQQATELARSMVVDFGMSDRVGPVTVGGSPLARSEPFLAPRVGQGLADTVDAEVRRLIEEAQGAATDLLRKNRELLASMAERLVEAEQLEGEALEEQLSRVCRGPELARPEPLTPDRP